MADRLVVTIAAQRQRQALPQVTGKLQLQTGYVLGNANDYIIAKYLAFDSPPDSSIRQKLKLLFEKELSGIWVYELLKAWRLGGHVTFTAPLDLWGIIWYVGC